MLRSGKKKKVASRAHDGSGAAEQQYSNSSSSSSSSVVLYGTHRDVHTGARDLCRRQRYESAFLKVSRSPREVRLQFFRPCVNTCVRRRVWRRRAKGDTAAMRLGSERNTELKRSTSMMMMMMMMTVVLTRCLCLRVISVTV